MNENLTKGPVMGSMLRFALPMILGNLLQQCYNVADTLIVGQFIGPDALAAVGSSFTLMTFLTSILLGLCMGSGAVFSIRCGQGDEKGLKEGICASFLMIASLTVVLNTLAFVFIDTILTFLKVPDEIWGLMRDYLVVIFYGIAATFLYNYFASLLTSSDTSRTLPIALSFFTSEFSYNYTRMFAALAIVIIPGILLYAVAQEQVQASVAATGIKE